jgi:short-subunit dehydrogenase
MAGKVSTPKSVLITGASSGIGQALAFSYARSGSTLFLSGRDRGRLDETLAQCRDYGADAEAEAVDVQDRAGMAKWIADADRHHPLDLVIANAGISGGSGGIGGEDDEQARDIFAVNLAGVLNTVLPAAAALKVHGHGQIAIMSSLAGFRGLPGAPAYSASKVAVRAYGEALRGALAADGIRVSVICPGFVESRITAANTYAMPFLMSPEKAAKAIRRGLERDRARIAFPWPMYATAWLLSTLPPILADPILRRIPKKV